MSIIIAVVSTMLVGLARAQEVHHAESFELSSTLSPNQSIEYKANDFIHLKKGFLSLPQSPNYALMEIDPYFNLEPSYGDTFWKPDDCYEVGRLGFYPMDFDVNDNGAAVISMPLEFPEGINGMTPQLSLEYNSQGGNGIMGLGWSLGGMSKISRVPYTYMYDDSCHAVQFSSIDELSLDGIVLRKGSKDNVVCYYPEIYDYSIVYPINGNIDNGFRVLKKDGNVYTYAAKYLLQSPLDTPIEWHLSRVEDPFGNYIEYNYQNDRNDGAFYPTSIRYTGHGEANPAYEIRFCYNGGDARADSPRKWFSKPGTNISVGFSRVTKKLTDIECWYGENRIMSYGLTYRNLDWRIPALWLVNKYTFDNGSKNGPINKLAPTEFQWAETDYRLQCETAADGISLNTEYNNNYLWQQFTAFAANFEPYKLSDDTLEKYEHDIVHLMETGDGSHCYFMNVFRSNNHIGEEGQRYAYNEGGLQYNCDNINNVSFCDGRHIVAFMPADTDGDGLDEIVCVSYYPSWHLVEVTLIKPNEAGTFVESEVCLSFSCLDEEHLKYFTIADFNGDGLSDIICLYDDGQSAFFRAGLSQASAPFSMPLVKSCNHYENRKVAVGDFDGSKKDQILLLGEQPNGNCRGYMYHVFKNQNGQYVFSGPKSIIEDVAENFFTPYNCYRLCLGDFNGDGKKDILLLCANKWRFYFSKGNGLFSEAVTNGMYHNDDFVCTNETGTASPAFMLVADLDNDGCDDLSVLKVKQSQADNYKRLFRRDFLFRPLCQPEMPDSIIIEKTGIYKWNGSVCDSTDLCIDSIQMYTTYYAAFNPFVVIMGNHKGTSPVEIMSCRMGYKNGADYLRAFLRNTGPLDNPPVRAVNKIITSIGATTEIGYRSMSFQPLQNDVFGREDDEECDDDRDLTPVLPYHGYMNVVERVMSETDEEKVDGVPVKTFRMTRYHFARPYYHTRGRGFLGFNRVWSRLQGQDPTGDVVTHKTFSLNNTYGMLVPLSMKRYNFEGPQNQQQLFSQTNYSYQFQDNSVFSGQLGQIPDDVFSPYLNESVTQRNDESPVSYEKEVTQKDGYGNVGQYQHRYGVTASSFPFYETTDMTYENNTSAGRWILGVAQTETLNQYLFEGNTNVITRRVTYENNMNTGRHAVKRTEPGNEKRLKEIYGYDEFGNLISTTYTGSGKTRVERVAYSDDGRFAITATNALGHVTHYYYDEANGRLDSLTDPNGLTTSYRYDILGDLIQTRYPTGVLEDQRQLWVGDPQGQNHHPDTPDFGGPVYLTYSKRSGERESYVFYDQHKRKLREVGCNMEGDRIYVDYKYYDISGRLRQVSNPYFPDMGETPQFNTYHYDYLGRNTRINRADGGFMSKSFAEATETTIGFDGQKTTLFYTKAGLVEYALRYERASVNNVATQFSYYGDGKVKTANSITYCYDVNRNPLSVSDPALGLLTYDYNAFGELVGSTTPRDESRYHYDALGRMIRRAGGDGDSYWVYDSGFIGALSSTYYVPISGPTVRERFRYDQFGNLIRQTQKVGDEMASAFDYTYNRLGKRSSITYPSGLKVKYHYNGKGFMDCVRDAATGDVLWQANASDRWDNISSFTEGDIDVDYSYDPVTGLVDSIGAKRDDQVLLDQAYHWTTTGNLQWRADATLDLKESFGYDGYNRLVTAVARNLAGTQTYSSQAFDYDFRGNITQKTGVGSYAYDATSNHYAVTGLQPETGQESLFPDQEATYTSFDKLQTLAQDGKTLSVDYGIDRQRVMQTFSDGTTTRTKRYFTPLYETVTENGVTKKLHYLTSSTGLFAIFASYNNGGGTMHYTLKDHQGNLTATISGNTVERLSYDAWGRRRNPVGFGYATVAEPVEATFDRGYTLHEHYDEFDLINMNGRLYDPVLGRMLSPDIAIQDEYNQQAYNRYSYCLNNPLRYTDPSGYFVRGSRNYYDWNSMVYYDFGNYRNNGSAFNTDLSEGKLSPVYDIDGVLLGTTKEGFTGQVLVYEGLEDIDFSSMTEQEALLYEGVDSYDNIRNSLSEEARSNIWTNIVSHFEGLRVYDEKFSLASITDNRIGFGGEGAWNTYMKSGHIKGSDLYKYETTVENIASSIIVHEWYSHLMKRNGNKMRSHRLAYKNVINYKPLWNETTDAYKGFVVRQLFKYTKGETGRTKVDPLYRYSYYKYKDY